LTSVNGKLGPKEENIEALHEAAIVAGIRNVLEPADE
jgi:hypothetical protein